MNGLDLNNLGELPAGFLIVVISMVCIGIGLLVFFIKKQWIFAREQNGSERAHHERTSEHKIILTTRTVILTTEYGKEVSDTTAGL